ncbi:hypothetical protein L249_5029, partial [Ophiocordyceps polyrhachis-furcata BCC 54312]
HLSFSTIYFDSVTHSLARPLPYAKDREFHRYTSPNSLFNFYPLSHHHGRLLTQDDSFALTGGVWSFHRIINRSRISNMNFVPDGPAGRRFLEGLLHDGWMELDDASGFLSIAYCPSKDLKRLVKSASRCQNRLSSPPDQRAIVATLKLIPSWVPFSETLSCAIKAKLFVPVLPTATLRFLESRRSCIVQRRHEEGGDQMTLVVHT